MALSALIIQVPEAEPYVAHLRERFDPSASRGMPAHVTLLYPFMPPDCVTGEVVEQVRSLVSAALEFDFRLIRIERFPNVLYLAPEPAVPFVELTLSLVRQFPEFPAFGGQHQSIVPHLTVAIANEAGQVSIEAELLATLPSDGITCLCKELVLVENSSGRWEPMHSFALCSFAP